MSGIVRGWTDASELRDLVEYGTWAKVFTDKDERMLDGPPIPVAVVPLDDATLAGMADALWFAMVNETTETSGEEGSIDLAMRHVLPSLRAALGLEGGR